MTVVNEWLALRRVHEGAVAAVEGRLFNHGRPVADYLAAALDELIRSEQLALGPADPAGMQRVCVTRAGQVRYLELNGNGAGVPRHGDE